MNRKSNSIFGAIAQFDGPTDLVLAARRLREAGYRDFECHSPFPIHGIDEAAGEKPSKVSLVAGIAALMGLCGAYLMQAWMNALDYPIVVSGKPFMSFMAFFPITFAGAVLFAAFGATFGFIYFMHFRYHHPIFHSKRFEQFSDDGFFVSIASSDPQFDAEKTVAFLASIGGKNVEILEKATHISGENTT